MTDQAPEPALPTAPRRKANRTSFKKGHTLGAMTHGLYSDRHPEAGAIVEAALKFEADQLIDEGEAEADIHSRRRRLITYRSRILDKNILKLAVALEERGIVDKRGKLRVAWISKLESLISVATQDRQPVRSGTPSERHQRLVA